VPNAPQIIASTEEICSGTGVSLLALGSGTLTWDNGVENNVEFFPAMTETYTATATNAGGCSSETSITITVNQSAVTPSISASSMDVCEGESVTLIASGPSNVTWNNGVQNGVAFTPSETTTYTVVGDEGNDCTSTNMIEIVVSPVPNAPQILATTEEICSGTGVTLLALGNITLTWDNGVENNVEFFPTETTTYTVTGNDGASCSSSTSIEIVVNQAPAVPTITIFAGTLVSSAISGNQWYLNGAPINGATSQTYAYTEPGNYTVVVTSNGCSSASSITEIFASVEEVLSKTVVYPNPAEDILNVNGLLPGTVFNLLDARGQLVKSTILNSSSTSIDITDLQSGVYVATMIYQNFAYHIKIVKQ
jgi:hypothetical protein